MNLFDEVCEMTLRVMCVSLSGFEITCEIVTLTSS